MPLPSISRPIRTVIRWQLIATAVVTAFGAWLGGVHGAASAVLGGSVNIIAALVFAVLARMIRPRGSVPPRGLQVAMVTLFRAEGGKVLAIIAQLWLVLSIYREIVPVAFFSAFVITVIVFSMAFFVHE